MRRIVILAVAALLAVAVAVPALGAPQKKGTTYVAPSATTVSVLQGVTAPGSLGAMGAGFGIVGNMNKGVIKHVGGLEIATTLGDVEIRNFWIDTNTGTVSAYVVELDARVTLFDLADVSVDAAGDVSATLLFNATASDVIVGSQAITGTPAGTALVDLP